MIQAIIFIFTLLLAILALLKSHSFFVLKSVTLFYLAFEYLGFAHLFLNDFYTITYGNFYSYIGELEVIFLVNSIVLSLVSVLLLAGSNALPKRSYTYVRSNLKGVAQLKLLVLIVVVVYLLNLDVSNLPLIVKLRGGSIYDVAVARHNAGNAVAGFRWYKYFFRDLAFYLMLVIMLKGNGFNQSNIIWLVLLSIFSVISGEKMPFMELLAFIFITNYFIIKGRKLRSVNILVPIALVPYLSLKLSFLADRLLVGQILPGVFYLKYFDENELLLGSSLPNPGSIFPYVPVDLTVVIMQFSGFNSSLNHLGVKGTMPFAFWGEIFANFGWLGVIVIIPLILMLLFALDLYWSSRKSYLEVAFHLYLAFVFKDMAVTGFSQFIFLWQVGIVLIALLIIKRKNAQEYYSYS